MSIHAFISTRQTFQQATRVTTVRPSVRPWLSPKGLVSIIANRDFAVRHDPARIWDLGGEPCWVDEAESSINALAPSCSMACRSTGIRAFRFLKTRCWRARPRATGNGNSGTSVIRTRVCSDLPRMGAALFHRGIVQSGTGVHPDGPTNDVHVRCNGRKCGGGQLPGDCLRWFSAWCCWLRCL